MSHKTSTTLGLLLLVLLVSLVAGVDYFIKERERNHHKMRDLHAQIEYLQGQIKPESEKNIRDIMAFMKHKYRLIPVEMTRLIAEHIERWSVEYNITPALVVGIIDVESDFNPLAISSKGARGLMQIMPMHWREELQVNSDFDFHGIETNIRGGIYIYLKYLELENNSIRRALNRYNGSDREKGEYANKVYQSIGEFTAFRNLRYRNEKTTDEGDGAAAESDANEPASVESRTDGAPDPGAVNAPAESGG